LYFLQPHRPTLKNPKEPPSHRTKTPQTMDNRATTDRTPAPTTAPTQKAGRTFNILDKNLPKAYLKALGFLFSSFLGSFKANFGPVFNGGLAHGILTTFYLGCCIAIKRGTLDREMGFKWGC
jgi:hypothetical protein